METETVTHVNAFQLPEEESGEGETTEQGLEISASNWGVKIITRKCKVCLIDSALAEQTSNIETLWFHQGWAWMALIL